MGIRIHVAAEPLEEFEQLRVVMKLARAVDVQEIRTGVGYRPMWRVELTSPPRHQKVFVTDVTVREERAVSGKAVST